LIGAASLISDSCAVAGPRCGVYLMPNCSVAPDASAPVKLFGSTRLKSGLPVRTGACNVTTSVVL